MLYKKNKIIKFINDELEISSDDSDDEVSDENTFDEEQIKTKYYDSAFGNFLLNGC